MNMLIDFCILVGCVLAGFFCIWRSHINFTKGYVRLGYVYLLLWLLAVIMFFVQAIRYGL